jgi:hypothetical protein
MTSFKGKWVYLLIIVVCLPVSYFVFSIISKAFFIPKQLTLTREDFHIVEARWTLDARSCSQQKNNCPLDIPKIEIYIKPRSDDLEFMCTPRVNDDTYEIEIFSPSSSSGNRILILSSSTVSPYRKTCENQRIEVCCRLVKQESSNTWTWVSNEFCDSVTLQHLC